MSASSFWKNSRSHWMRVFFSPFIVTLTSGTLNPHTYERYIIRDRYIVKSIAHVLELVEECVEEDDIKISIRQLRKHDYFVPKQSPESPDGVHKYPISSFTKEYADYLLATASGKIEGVNLAIPSEKTKVAAYTLGAVLPWLDIYAYIGKNLKTHVYDQALIPLEQLKTYADEQFKKELDLDSFACGDSHQHKDWLDFYASDNFQDLTCEFTGLLDKLSVKLYREERDIVQKLYHRSMKLTSDFFDDQSLEHATSVPLLRGQYAARQHLMVFSGFDFTCSVVSSSAILAKIAKGAPNSDQEQIDQFISANMTGIQGRLLCREYTEEFQQCITNIINAEESSKKSIVNYYNEIRDRRIQTGKGEKFDYIALKKALDQLSKFEKDANTIVFESGVLKGLNHEDIKREGESLVFQDGCLCFFKSITKREGISVSIHVLSSCWCNDLIKSAFSSADLPEIDIHANEFIYDEDFTSTGRIVRKIECPNDKVKCFENIILEKSDDKENLIVYIGQSVSDLQCLLDADIGIVFDSSDSLVSVGKCFGVSFVDLFKALVRKQKGLVPWDNSYCWTKKSGTLYTVSKWSEIHAFLLDFNKKW